MSSSTFRKRTMFMKSVCILMLLLFLFSFVVRLCNSHLQYKNQKISINAIVLHIDLINQWRPRSPPSVSTQILCVHILCHLFISLDIIYLVCITTSPLTIYTSFIVYITTIQSTHIIYNIPTI